MATFHDDARAAIEELVARMLGTTRYTPRVYAGALAYTGQSDMLQLPATVVEHLQTDVQILDSADPDFGEFVFTWGLSAWGGTDVHWAR